MPELRVGLAIAPSREQQTQQAYSPEAVSSLIQESIRQYLPDGDPRVPVFSNLVEPGMTVLLKPNWVLHYNQYAKGRGNLACMFTQPTFLLAALKHVLAAMPRRIIIGDAPIQGCQWESLATPALMRQVAELAGGVPVDIIDFRRIVVRDLDFVSGVMTDQRAESRYCLFDLGKDSLLEPISQPEGRFRVTMYDPRMLAATHAPHRHQYLICREALESDLILNLPKLKTHRKAGITGALKNLVGINGNKDYLPHHRVGGTAWGGDCYPGVAPVKRLAEYWLDRANQNIGSRGYANYHRLAVASLRLQKLLGDADIEGGWYGNDTVWRMVLDLNRILIYGRPDGSMADAPQRRVYSLTDAIVCGQGDGPLAPEACPVGAVTFSNSPSAADWTHALLLGLDPERIPQVRESFGNFRWPLAPPDAQVEVHYQDQAIREAASVLKLGKSARPAKGWIGHCELAQGGGD